MYVPDAGDISDAQTMQTLAVIKPWPGVFRVTSLLSSDSYRADWDERAIAANLQFPGVASDDFNVRRFDSERGIIDVEFTPSVENTMMRRWLNTVEIGSRTTIAGTKSTHFPNFASGRRVLMFADETAMPAVREILERWPPSARGMVWIDTPRPSDVADLPVADGIGVVSFHVEMGFDPLVTAARRIELDSSTTVWGAGERTRMDAIRDTCRAAGLSSEDTRLFGYWSTRSPRRPY